MELNWIIRTTKKGFEFKVRNWVMFMLHHPISVANLLLVPSCGVSFPRCYLCWSLGGWLQRLAWDTMVSAHKFRVRREDWSTQETHAREWDVSTLNKLSHLFFCNDWNYQLDHNLSQTGDYSAYAYKALKWHFGSVFDLQSGRLCVVFNGDKDCNRPKSIYYLNIHICPIRWSVGG